MSSQSAKRHRIGYALASQKVASFIQPSLVDHAGRHGVDLVPIDLLKPLTEQGTFDCVVHKLYDPNWKLQLQEFSAKNPHVPIIDPLDHVERLHNRISMLQVVSRLKFPKRSEVLAAPKQVVVLDPEDLKGNVVIGELGFPLIAKPVLANGSIKSHQMYLLFDGEGLERLCTPIILQEFVNHGGVIFKVYVAGNYVQCVKRKSLPDISEEMLVTLKGSMLFSQISNLPVNENSVNFERVKIPPLDFVEEVASALREELGINLFNFDMIRDASDGNRYLVIDINYLPGYAKMPDYEPTLTKFFLDVVQREGKEEVVENNEEGDKGRKFCYQNGKDD